MNKQIKEVIHELKHHAPFTFLAAFVAILIAILIQNQNLSEEIFHIMHPLHVLASAIVTSAIFYKYKKSFFKAILVGISGAIIIGSLSDIIFPYFGGMIFQIKMDFHLPIIKEPLIILSSAIVGSIIGIKTLQTKMPHFIHVSLSIFASLFYLLAFSQIGFGFLHLISIFAIVFATVLIPCCLSDIIFPFLFLGKKIKNCSCK